MTDQQKIKQIADEADRLISNVLNIDVSGMSLEARGLVLGFVTNLKEVINQFEQAGKEII